MYYEPYRMITSSTKYSFVLPAYKSQFLKEAISSILAQTYRDFELVIVDDASPNDVKGVVDLFDDSRIRYYRNEKNIGGKNLVAQWNHSIQYANGDWVIIATDDDLYEKVFLETADNLLSKYPNVDIFRGRISSFNSSTPETIRDTEICMPEIACFEEFAYSMFHGLFGGVPEYVFRRNTLIEIGGFVAFPKAWGSDDATALLLARKGITCSSEYLVRFRYSGQNISSDGNFLEEKTAATIMKYAFYYEKIIPLLSDGTIYKKHWSQILRNIYPFDVKKDILNQIYKIPLLRRKQFFDLIDKCTPYLDTRNKFTLKLRVFLKIK